MIDQTVAEDQEPAARNGFTILELLIALAVLSVSLLGMAQLLGVAVQQNHFARYNTAAVEVARGKVEQLKARFNREVETGVPATDLTVGSHGPETVVLNSGNSNYGSRTLTVTWQVTSPGGSRKDVAIFVNQQGVTSPSGAALLQSKTVTFNTSFTP